ncbi:MAG TPA: hypothetical protein VLM89_13135 [Phycisphaerae bacterium]|nr:hypothetical protein [Phycisphaerae bacterium]
MSKVHAFTGDTSGGCRVILHTAMPAGNNLVGRTWKSCWIAAGRNTTSMVEGNGIGQISAAEKAQVVAGDVIELSGEVPLSVVGQGTAAVSAFADALVATRLGSLANEFNYYGHTQD